MSNTTEHFAIDDLRRIARHVAAGLTSAQIARQLTDAGVQVSRDATNERATPTGALPNGYNLPTEPGNPSRWTAAAVDAVKAAPEYVATNNYAAARAKLGSDFTTTLTIT